MQSLKKFERANLFLESSVKCFVQANRIQKEENKFYQVLYTKEAYGFSRIFASTGNGPAEKNWSN